MLFKSQTTDATGAGMVEDIENEDIVGLFNGKVIDACDSDDLKWVSDFKLKFFIFQ